MSFILESEVLNVSGRPVRVLREDLTIKQVAQEIANVRDAQVSQCLLLQILSYLIHN